MAYKKTNWQDTFKDAQGNVTQEGTKISASRLNKMEDGIAGSASKEELGEVIGQLAEKVGGQRKATMNDLGQDVKEALTGGSVAVVGVNAVATENVQPNAITPEKINVFRKPNNLFNQRTATHYKAIDTTNGALKDDSLSSVSDFIEVVGGESLIKKNANRYVSYDADKALINSSTADSYTVPANAKFIRVTVLMSNLSTAQINKGTVLLPYEKYIYSMQDSDQTPLLIQPSVNSVGKNELQEDAVTEKHATFMVQTNNIYNKATDTIGKTMDATGVVIDSDRNLSDFIPVTDGERISFNPAISSRIGLYDANKKFVSRTGVTTDVTAYTIPTGVGVRFIRLSPAAVYDRLMVSKSTTQLPYEKYGFIIDTEVLPSRLKEKEFDWAHSQNYFIDGKLDGTFTSPMLPQMSAGATKPLYDYKTADFYADYDALMAKYPNYITRTLGTHEATGIPIYRYDFKPPAVRDEPIPTKPAKMILVSGSHPEKAGVWCMFQAMKQICERWKENEHLETLRENVHFIVIPVWAPWNMDNNMRWNSNLVNVGRNFPHQFVVKPVEDVKYGGTQPLTEPESIYLHKVLMENKDALVHIDFHNHFATADFIWIAAKADAPTSVGKALVKKMSRNWKPRFPIIPQDDSYYAGYASNSDPEGHNVTFAETLGMRSATFEVGQSTPWEPYSPRFSSMAITLGVEAFVNYLLLMLKYTVEEKNNGS